MSKKLLSLVLAVVMLVLAVPAAVLPVLAVEVDTDAKPPEVWSGSESNAEVKTITDGTNRLFVWMDGTEVLATGATLTPDAKCVVNPQLYEKGIIEADDTVKEAFDKFTAYLKENAKITYKGGWTIDNASIDKLEPIEYYNYYHNRTVFLITTDGTKVADQSNAFWTTESGITAIFDGMWNCITQSLTGNEIAADVALNSSEVYKTVVKPHTYNLSATMYNYAGNHYTLTPSTSGSGREGAYTWTSYGAGYAKLEVQDIAGINANKARPVKFNVLFNGYAQLDDYVEINMSADDAEQTINDVLSTLEIPMFEGDKVSIVFARVDSAQDVSTFNVKVELDTTRTPPPAPLPPETWSGSATNAEVKTITDGTNRLFVWMDGTEELASGKTLTPDAKCVVNPQLYAKGIIERDDTVREAFEKFTAYLKENAKITYKGGWTLNNAGVDKLEPMEYYNYYNNRNIFMITTDGTKVNDLGNAFWTTEFGITKVFEGMWSCITESLSGNEIVADVALTSSEVYKKVVKPHTYTLSATMYESAGNHYIITPSTVGSGFEVAYTWTSYGAGVVELDVQAISGTNKNKDRFVLFNVLVNGQLLLPEYQQINMSASNAAELMNETLSALTIPVFEGDEVSIIFARTDSSQAISTFNITAELDTTRVPVVYKRNGEVVEQFVAGLNDPIPELNNAPDFGAFGYRVNGVYCKTLPETVTGATIIEDYYISSAASITITNKYAINIFVKPEEGAIGGGIIVNNEMMEGELQADGTYKVVATSVNASALRTASVTYTPYLVYPEGYRIDLYEKTASALDLLNAYVAGNYDQTTKNLAQSVLDFTVALDAFLTNADPSADVKLRLRGEPTIPGVSLSGKNEIYLGTLKYITTGEVPKYSDNPSQAFVADPTVTEDDKVKMGYEEGVNPTSSEFKYAIKAVTLNFEERVGFAFRIVANTGNTLSDLRAGGKYALQVFDGISYSYYDAFLYENASKNTKGVVVDGVPASRYDYDTEFTVVERQEDGTYTAVSATLTYSMKAYAVTKFTFGRESSANYLAQALFRLGVVADEYVAAHPVA